MGHGLAGGMENAARRVCQRECVRAGAGPGAVLLSDIYERHGHRVKY